MPIGYDGNISKPYIKSLEISKIEKEVLFALISELYGDPGTSNISIVDIADKIQISKNKSEKVVESLVKKEIFFMDDKCDNIIHLCKPFWYLHSVWSSEVDEKDFKKIDNLK